MNAIYYIVLYNYYYYIILYMYIEHLIQFNLSKLNLSLHSNVFNSNDNELKIKLKL